VATDVAARGLDIPKVRWMTWKKNEEHPEHELGNTSEKRKELKETGKLREHPEKNMGHPDGLATEKLG
jgi:hypothetical protein